MTFINSTLNKTMTGQVFLSPVLWLILILVVVLSGTISGWMIRLQLFTDSGSEAYHRQEPPTGKIEQVELFIPDSSLYNLFDACSRSDIDIKTVKIYNIRK